MTNIEAIKLGESIIGKMAQSRLLTMIDSKGNKVLEPAQKITGYEVITEFMESEVMAIIGGESVYEETLIYF